MSGPVFSYSDLLARLGVNALALNNDTEVQVLADRLGRDALVAVALLDAYGDEATLPFDSQSGTPNGSISFFTTTFSGWGSMVGVRQSFSRVHFDLYAFDSGNPVKAVRVRVRDSTPTGTVLADVVRSVATVTNQTVRVTVDLGKVITSSNPLYVEYICDGYTGVRLLTSLVYPSPVDQGRYYLGVHYLDLSGQNVMTTQANVWFAFSLDGTNAGVFQSGPTAGLSFPYNSTTFSAWAGPVGTAQYADRVGFALRAFDAAHLPTKLRVRILAGTDQNGTVLADKTVTLPAVVVNAATWVTIDLDTPIINTAIAPLWVELLSDGYWSFFNTGVVYPEPAYHRMRYVLGGQYSGSSAWADVTSANTGIFFQFKAVDLKGRTTSGGDLAAKVGTGTGSGAAGAPAVGAILSIPAKLYAQQGKEFNVYFRDCVRSEYFDLLKFDVTCNRAGTDIGQQQAERWTATPVVGDVGTWTWTLDIWFNNQIIATATSSLIVEGSAITPVTRKALFVGDSTMAGGQEIAEIINLCAAAGLTLTTVGTKTSTFNDAGSVSRTSHHEAISGWAYSTFYTDPTSPFVFSGAFNFAQYLSTNGITLAANDWVIFNLGSNEMLGVTNDANWTTQYQTAATALAAMTANIKAAVSGIRVGYCITHAPAASQDAFGANYGNGLTQWRYNRSRFQFAEALIANYGALESSNQFVVPSGIALDTVNNMLTTAANVNFYNSTQLTRESNGVHPATSGYYQIGSEIAYFLIGLA